MFPQNLFNDEKTFKTLPVLEFKREFVGPTDYIDRIRVQDVSDPLMTGVDCYKRSLITLRMKFTAKEDLYRIKKDEDKTVVNTYFQRYTDSDGPYVIGTCYGLECKIGETLPSKEEVENIRELINYGKVETKEFIIELV